MAHITYKQIADDLLASDWGQEHGSVNAAIKTITVEERVMCLLVDIAQSLRILRCSNFTDVPRRLDKIRLAAEGIRRERKQRKKR